MKINDQIHIESRQIAVCLLEKNKGENNFPLFRSIIALSNSFFLYALIFSLFFMAIPFFSINKAEGAITEFSSYCGDGTVNQDWEQCDGSSNCASTCQFKEQNQCSDLVLAKVNVNEVKNWNQNEGADMTSNIFLGSSTNKIPQGVWFLIYRLGQYITDPDIAGYENVPGFAIQRLSGELRTLMRGSHPEKKDKNNIGKEHIDGNIEFLNIGITGQRSDDTIEIVSNMGNKLENGFNGTGKGKYDTINDEAWIADGKSNFWLTVDTADDGFYTKYGTAPKCDLPNQKPVITLLGDSSVTLTVGNAFTDPGATASDAEDGDLTSNIVKGGDTVDASKIGTYVITYNVTDSKGLVGLEVKRTVAVNAGGGGGGGSISGGGGTFGGGYIRLPVSAVSTVAAVVESTPPGKCEYLLEYIKRGAKNNPLEVLKLQVFLLNYENMKIPITGVYDEASYRAVGVFQKKYNIDVLDPWGFIDPTGWVYYTTRKKVNEIYCKKDFPLTQAQKDYIARFKAYLLDVRAGKITPKNVIEKLNEIAKRNQTTKQALASLGLIDPRIQNLGATTSSRNLASAIFEAEKTAKMLLKDKYILASLPILTNGKLMIALISLIIFIPFAFFIGFNRGKKSKSGMW